CGTIGIISPYSKDFCKSCNRLRVSSTGGLRLCLFGEKDLSLRPWLQNPFQRRELMQVIRNQIVRKPVSHFLFDKNFGDTFNLSAIGG
ncbi:MAG: GTP 3',8-cyclase MoaA, partial [Deltaproteobacteria bacterium]|nr:GTP 3',8-cyclase MoaA [Deltaproteobacteria bacterium]